MLNEGNRICTPLPPESGSPLYYTSEPILTGVYVLVSFSVSSREWQTRMVDSRRQVKQIPKDKDSKSYLSEVDEGTHGDTEGDVDIN